MSTLPSWAVLAIVLAIWGVILGFGLWALRREKSRDIKETEVDCPVHGEHYHARVLEDKKTGEKLAVLGCEAWRDWHKAGCSGECMKQHAPAAEVKSPSPESNTAKT